MPTVIEVNDLRNGYVDVCEFVLLHGEETSPRGQRTRELLDVVIRLEDPTDALPLGVGRKLNPDIAAAEAAQLIGAWSNPHLMIAIQGNFSRFTNDGSFWGAYGLRIGNQLLEVERKLLEDPDSRQAVITLWDPTLDNVPDKNDYPCTTMLQFLIRNGRLIMHTTMRSNDVWWGLAYDAFQFTQLQLTLANALGIPAGAYHHHAVSLHAYARDFDAITALHRTTDENVRVSLGFGLGNEVGVAGAMHRARVVGQGGLPDNVSEYWYADRLREYYP